MKLFYREFGTGEKNLMVIHGLFGSSKNWIGNSKELSEDRKVYAIDLRNHGDSPHSDSHTLDDMISDLKEFIEDHNIRNPILLGHSMGGLNAMYFALRFPDLISGLMIVDIAPRNYEVHYDREFACLNLDVSQFTSRSDLDLEMSKIYPDPFIRQFLQMNLEKLETGYKWKLNVPSLQAAKKALYFEKANLQAFQKKSLFILGEDSDYINDSDLDLIQKHFPNSEINWISGAGHYLHFTHQKKFMELCLAHLSNRE
jgi:pimeloyl-ACP methyl ester carboxylesterase